VERLAYQQMANARNQQPQQEKIKRHTMLGDRLAIDSWALDRINKEKLP